MKCIFCEIVEKKLSSRIIFEDAFTMAFLDIADDVDGHTIVIPKKHVVNIFDCDSETLFRLINTVQFVSKHYVDDCGFKGVNLLNANGIEAQQSVSHFHIHIIPRIKNDNIDAWPVFGGSNQQIEEIWKKLRVYARK